MLPPLRRLPLLAALVVGVVCWTGASGLQAQPGGSPSAVEIETALKRWLEAEQLIAKEQADWRRDQEILEALVQLLEAENARLDRHLQSLEQITTRSKGDRETLAAELAVLKERPARLEPRLAAIEGRLQRLVNNLPDGLREALEAEAAFLRDRSNGDGDAKASVLQRLQRLVAAVTWLQRFNDRVTIRTEERELPGGRSVLVETIYFGLGQAYYVSLAGDTAGVGRPGADGRWQWQAQADLVEPVSRALLIHRRLRDAATVRLPVSVSTSPSAAASVSNEGDGGRDGGD